MTGACDSKVTAYFDVEIFESGVDQSQGVASCLRFRFVCNVLFLAVLLSLQRGYVQTHGESYITSESSSRPFLSFPLQVQSSDPDSKEFRVQLEEYGLTSKMYPTGDPDVSRKKLASSDVLWFSWPTKIDFGHGGVEIVSEFSNNRFLFRDSAHEPFKISPVPIAGPHSVIYNPKDHLYYAGDSGNNRVITF